MIVCSTATLYSIFLIASIRNCFSLPLGNIMGVFCEKVTEAAELMGLGDGQKMEAFLEIQREQQ